jgi:hypothetical protein
VEAKHFSNSELWATGKPEIIKEYGRYIEGINRIFETKLPAPEGIDPKVSLLIFGFDGAQKQGDRFKKLIWNKPEYQQIPIYHRGDPKGLNAETLWNEAK